MKCKCGYNGPADIVHPNTNQAKSYFKCPECKSSDNILYVTGIDDVKLAMKRPVTKKEEKEQDCIEYNFEIVRFNTGRLLEKESKVGFGIESHKDHSGHSYGWITMEEYEHLKQWTKDVNIYDDKHHAFGEIDCYICNHIKPNEKCDYHINKLIGECEGLSIEMQKDMKHFMVKKAGWKKKKFGGDGTEYLSKVKDKS